MLYHTILYYRVAKSQKDKVKKDKQGKLDVKSVPSSRDTRTPQGISAAAAGKDSAGVNSGVDRKHLHNYRVVQRNLVYVIGMPANTASDDIIRSAAYFGQYGKITKTVIHKNNNISLNTVSAYCTFAYKEDARAAIQALDGYWLEGHQLRASFGTTKYCNSFVRGVACSNPECVYLHDYGEDQDRYTKEDIVVSLIKSCIIIYTVYVCACVFMIMVYYMVFPMCYCNVLYICVCLCIYDNGILYCMVIVMYLLFIVMLYRTHR